MTKILKINYPWSHLKPGQGFFIPCLDTAKVREEGLRAAVSVRRFNAKAQVGVLEGRVGVLFFS